MPIDSMELACAPNFFVVGTAKSATSTIFSHLERHPDVGLAKVWEPNFFAEDSVFCRGMDWYLTLFEHCSGRKAIGEKSWRYSVSGVYPNAFSRLYSAFPKAKIVYVVRDPFARIESLWIDFRSSGAYKVDNDFNKAIIEDNIFVESSLYSKQIYPYRRNFGEENVYVLFYEKFVINPAVELNKLCEFLGVFPIRWDLNTWANKSLGKRMDSLALDRLRLLPFFPKVRDRMPQGFRAAARLLLKRPVEEVIWNDVAMRFFSDSILHDFRGFVSDFPEASEFWTMSREKLEL